MPRLRRTAARIAFRAGSSREIAASGSRSEIRSVERCRSAQRTVRYFRSPAIRLRDSAITAVGGWSGTAAPHDEQKRSPALRIEKQTWQDTLCSPDPSPAYQNLMAEQAFGRMTAPGPSPVEQICRPGTSRVRGRRDNFEEYSELDGSTQPNLHV